jgi:hypothetical protein
MRKTFAKLFLGAFAGSLILGPTVATAGAPPCTSVAKRIASGAPGPLNCSANGVATVYVAKQTTLPLATMAVTVTGVRMTRTLVEKVGGTTISHATAQGMFVVVTVRVANRTHKPQLFNDDSQVELLIGSDTYSISASGDEADSATSAFDSDIEPGETATGDVVFDVAKSVLKSYPAHAGLVVVNFGDFVSFGSVSQIGVVYLG